MYRERGRERERECVPTCVWLCLPTPPHKRDTTQSIFQRNLTGFEFSFLFLQTVFFPSLKVTICPAIYP